MAFRRALEPQTLSFSQSLAPVLPRRFHTVAGALALFAVLGCEPQIGDECTTSVDCSQTGERLCDVTQPGGYCTVFSCAGDGCPDDSVCVAFGTRDSAAPGCENANGLSRFARSACMASCDSDTDCRSGYDCIAVGAPGNPWSALVVSGRASSKICIAPPRAMPVTLDEEPGVCKPPSTGGSSETSGPPGQGS